MIKFVDTKIVFQEVPDEVTLAINLSNCPCHCKGCHSPYLAEDIGEELTVERLVQLVTEAECITCVCFMGGDSDTKRLNRLAKLTKEELDLKVAWYSGRDKLGEYIDINNFDYIKLGHYDEEYGPLNSPDTNQVMYKVDKGGLVDITNKFWNESKS